MEEKARALLGAAARKLWSAGREKELASIELLHTDTESVIASSLRFPRPSQRSSAPILSNPRLIRPISPEMHPPAVAPASAWLRPTQRRRTTLTLPFRRTASFPDRFLSSSARFL